MSNTKEDIKKSIITKAKEFCYTFYMLLDQLQKSTSHTTPQVSKDKMHEVMSPIKPAKPAAEKKSEGNSDGSGRDRVSIRSYGYTLFHKDQSKNILNDEPNISPLFLNKAIYNKWRDLTDNERSHWKSRAGSLRKRQENKAKKENNIGIIQNKKRHSLSSFRRKSTASSRNANRFTRSHKHPIPPVKAERESHENTGTRIEQMQSLLAQKAEQKRKLAQKGSLIEQPMQMEAVANN